MKDELAAARQDAARTEGALRAEIEGMKRVQDELQAKLDAALKAAEPAPVVVADRVETGVRRRAADDDDADAEAALAVGPPKRPRVEVRDETSELPPQRSGSGLFTGFNDMVERLNTNFHTQAADGTASPHAEKRGSPPTAAVLDRELSELRRANAELATEHAQAKVALGDLQSKHAQAEAALAGAKSGLEALSRIRAEHQESQAAVAGLERDLCELRKAHTDMTTKHAHAEAALAAAKNELEDRSRLRAEHQESQAIAVALCRDLSELRRENTDLSTKLAQAEAALGEAANEIERLSRVCAEHQESQFTTADRDKDLFELRKANTDLSTRHAEVEAALATATAEIEGLHAAARSAEAEHSGRANLLWKAEMRLTVAQEGAAQREAELRGELAALQQTAGDLLADAGYLRGTLETVRAAHDEECAALREENARLLSEGETVRAEHRKLCSKLLELAVSANE
ncbi:hypothetical protein PsYK624_166220 [Phanerochaete sordida]|uniref:Uncharacterized protein n=1 Tax=Phanerochaete sordida TaxID=48140 RepID=A0A9P3GSY0_9APHY|nr:hypothetical protein PsYK624_166220 [Phanerochaete sordida]